MVTRLVALRQCVRRGVGKGGRKVGQCAQNSGALLAAHLFAADIVCSCSPSCRGIPSSPRCVSIYARGLQRINKLFTPPTDGRSRGRDVRRPTTAPTTSPFFHGWRSASVCLLSVLPREECSRGVREMLHSVTRGSSRRVAF